jgi:hypothetical protein
MNLCKRIKKLEESTGRRRVVGRWLRESEKPEVVRARMLAKGEIAEGDFVQFVRWRTREEEGALRGAPPSSSLKPERL